MFDPRTDSSVDGHRCQMGQKTKLLASPNAEGILEKAEREVRSMEIVAYLDDQGISPWHQLLSVEREIGQKQQ